MLLCGGLFFDCTRLKGSAMPRLDRQDNVFVLALGDGENRSPPDWSASVNGALDEVERAEGHRALVTTATGKFYSNGLDLDWLFAHPDPQHRDPRSGPGPLPR